ncbi:MAG: hypothetical protein Unbinned80contig1000_60 [Prokaryotic dsDNA virus sp.]|nr:MAG: hypothetical protein Unbinned80contig1000_60 [Prokaryotic dsDNA virus sp.]|tara:strand:+ start:262 stop:633 length:372 start_codon:yes stop_codon:yes gene_type:complete
MASTLGTVASPLGQFLITHSTGTSISVENNVTGTAPTLYNIVITNNSSVSAYLKIAETQSVANADVANPDFKFFAPANSTVSYINGTGQPVATALTFWVTSTQANATTQGVPADTVTVRIVAQ